MRFLKQMIICPYCLECVYAKKAAPICPICSKDIPVAIFGSKNIRISTIGTNACAGKSTYIATMISELMKALGSPLSLNPLDEKTKKLQQEHHKLLYKDLMPLPATIPCFPEPQIWSIEKVSQDHIYKRLPLCTFTIYDGAGEIYYDIDASNPLLNDAHTCDAMIFVIDPLDFSEIISDGYVSKEIAQMSRAGSNVWSEVVHAEGIVNDIARYLRFVNQKKYTMNTSIEIPVAVIISKFDVVCNHPLFGNNPIVRNPSTNTKFSKVNMSEINEVHCEIEDWLIAINEHALTNALKANFPNHKFFGISNYGQPPKDDGTLNKPNPHRVLDPILWLFKNKEFID